MTRYRWWLIAAVAVYVALVVVAVTVRPWTHGDEGWLPPPDRQAPPLTPDP
jgi:hypothetical protein